MTTIPSKTLLLFESGASMEISATVHEASGDKSRSIDAYIVTPLGQEFEDSALRGAETVFLAMRNHPLFPEKYNKQLTVAYDLKKPSGNHGYTGHSAELGFAIALAKTIFNHDPGPVAATGIIDNVSAGTLAKVNGLESKLKGAATPLPSGGTILFPAENEGDISDETRKLLSEKEITLQPIHTIDEAIEILFPQNNQKKTMTQETHTKKTYPSLGRSLLLSLLAAFILVGGWLYMSRIVYPQLSNNDLRHFDSYEGSHGYESDEPLPAAKKQHHSKPGYE